jgi:HNH endonuclease
MTNISLFASQITEGPTGECWPWNGTKTNAGYGTFLCEGVKRTAHSIAYRFFVGEVPSGCHVHHKCRNRSCCNPAHLECLGAKRHRKEHEPALLEMTRKREEKRTHCKRGHPLSGENLYKSKPGSRRCATCSRDKAREFARRPSEVARRKEYMKRYYLTTN